MSKKMIYSLLTLLLVSCSSSTIKEISMNILNKSNIVKKNKINTLLVENKLDLVNGEINTYLIKNIETNFVPLILIDLDISNGVADGIYIENTNAKKMILDFNIIGTKTINKEIPIIATKMKDLEINLKNEIEVDNTNFVLEKIKRNDIYFYILKPIFITEDTFLLKTNQKIKKNRNIKANYEENVINEYISKKMINEKIYINSYLKLEKGNEFIGKGIKNNEIIIVLENGFQIFTTTDEKGSYKVILPNETKKIKTIQRIVNEKNKRKFNEIINEVEVIKK